MENIVKINQFDVYSEKKKQEAKEFLKFEIKRIDNYLKNCNDYYEIKSTLEIKKTCEKVLNSKIMLDLYLNEAIKKIIIDILNGLYSTSEIFNSDFIKTLKKTGFIDNEGFFEDYESIEDVRRYLFNQIGIEYISISELRNENIEAKAAQDDERLKINKLLYIQQGIDENFHTYSKKTFTISAIANMSIEDLELLTKKNTRKTK